MIVPGRLSLHKDPLVWIDTWVRSAALEDLILGFGGTAHSGRDLGSWLAHLEDFSRRWDFRNGRERDQARVCDLPEDVASLVFSAAEALGLRGEQRPTLGYYQHLVILGGLTRACFGRTLYAAQLLRDGGVTADRVVALATARPLSTDELAQSSGWFRRPAEDEHQAMCASVESAFGVTAPADQREGRGGAVISEYLAPGDLQVHVVDAPSLDPARGRANTADTYAWLAEESGWIRRGDAALLITTDIYVPFQWADAVRMLTLPHGVDVAFAGIELGSVDPRLTQPFSACDYLQEVRSTIRSLRMLRQALDP